MSLPRETLNLTIHEDYEVKKLLSQLRMPAQLRKEYLHTAQKIDVIQETLKSQQFSIDRLTKINEAYQGSFTQMMDIIDKLEADIKTMAKKSKPNKLTEKKKARKQSEVKQEKEIENGKG